ERGFVHGHLAVAVDLAHPIQLHVRHPHLRIRIHPAAGTAIVDAANAGTDDVTTRGARVVARCVARPSPCTRPPLRTVPAANIRHSMSRERFRGHRSAHWTTRMVAAIFRQFDASPRGNPSTSTRPRVRSEKSHRTDAPPHGSPPDA